MAFRKFSVIILIQLIENKQQLVCVSLGIRPGRMRAWFSHPCLLFSGRGNDEGENHSEVNSHPSFLWILLFPFLSSLCSSLRLSVEVICYMHGFNLRSKFYLENLGYITGGVFEWGKLGEKELLPGLPSYFVGNYRAEAHNLWGRALLGIIALFPIWLQKSFLLPHS